MVSCTADLQPGQHEHRLLQLRYGACEHCWSYKVSTAPVVALQMREGVLLLSSACLDAEGDHARHGEMVFAREGLWLHHG